MKAVRKTQSMLGCCGIDCGLCPRYYTQGSSQCPGCGGVDFDKKHPACGVLSCCVAKRNLEVCALCVDFPCSKYDSEDQCYDSFVTHQRIFSNHAFIREHGLSAFLEQQALRMHLLKHLLEHYDDGRSKSFYCLACALLPLEVLEMLGQKLQAQTQDVGLKAKNRWLRELLLEEAARQGIELKLKTRK